MRSSLQAHEFLDHFGLYLPPATSSPPTPSAQAWICAHSRIAKLSRATDAALGAMRAGDVLATAHELADVAYAAYVVGWSFGVDLDCIVAELHRSNLSKLAADGTPIHRTDGKVLKGPNFTPPSVARALATDQPLRSPYAQVYNFHTVFDSPCSDSLITDFTPALISLRCALLEEELAEVLAGAQASDLDNLLLELGDVLYVTYGAAVCWGIPLDSVINEVHTANLTTTLRPLAP